MHGLLKNPVEIPEYVLLSEELYGGGGAVSAPVPEIAPELEGVGPVRAFSVDVHDLQWSLPLLPAPSWTGRGPASAQRGSGAASQASMSA